MIYLSQEETRNALPFNKLLYAINQGFCSYCTVPLRHHHLMENESQKNDVLLLMPAWNNNDWGGVKLVNVHPGNSELGLPSIHSSYVLFDRKTGEHKLILHGGELTARRTAAASALAAKRLARPDSKSLLVVGSGVVASNIPYAYREAFALEEVQVWSRKKDNSDILVKRLNEDGFKAYAVSENGLESAVGRSDIISCSTLTTTPIIKGEWLKPGQHLDLIGSFTPEMREADDLALQRSSVYIDTDHAKEESGDLLIPLNSGAISETHIMGTLQDLCKNDEYPHRSNSEITLFKSVGTAIEDLSAAVQAYRSLN